MEHSVQQMIGSTYLGLIIAGLDCCGRFSTVGGLKSIIFHIWHYLVMCLLIFLNVTTLVAIILSKESSLPLIIDFIRIFSALYRFSCLTLQKNKFKRIMDKLENSLEMFPNVKIQENNYSKFVILVVLYASAQGYFQIYFKIIFRII